MSVIFKQKEFDQITLFFKTTALILLLLLIFLMTANYFFAARINLLKDKLEIMNEEERKYETLISKLKGDFPAQEKGREKTNLIIKLAAYADQIVYESIYLKDKKITINAFTAEQQRIFSLLKKLKRDRQFNKVNLLNINQKSDYYFQVETLISSD